MADQLLCSSTLTVHLLLPLHLKDVPQSVDVVELKRKEKSNEKMKTVIIKFQSFQSIRKVITHRLMVMTCNLKRLKREMDSRIAFKSRQKQHFVHYEWASVCVCGQKYILMNGLPIFFQRTFFPLHPFLKEFPFWICEVPFFFQSNPNVLSHWRSRNW